MRYFQQLLFGSAIAAVCVLIAGEGFAVPATGCVFSGTGPNAETCTLVEASESAEPGGSETITATSLFIFTSSGYIPIFESAAGATTSAFPTSTNPAGVTGAVSDYVFITGQTMTLVSNGFPTALLTSLLAGMTRLTPLGSDGTTPIVLSEPNEGILDQPVDFYMTIPGLTRLEHVVVYSDVPEPASLALVGLGLGGLSIIRRRKRA